MMDSYTAPLVSVVLPVYNGQEFLEEAVNSILAQSYQRFELIIVNDGSTDSTGAIIGSFTDERIKPIINPVNRGLVYSLNEGISYASGSYIARMDADDICHPRRLEKQVAMMEGDVSIGVCGTLLQEFTGNKNIQVWHTPEHHENIVAEMFTDSNIWHPTVMIRKRVLESSGINYKEYLRCEDYQLWYELHFVTRFYNIQEVLFYYRKHPNQAQNKRNDAYIVKREFLALLLQRQPDEEEDTLHKRLHGELAVSGSSEFIEIEDWIKVLVKRNQECRMFNEPTFSKALLQKLETGKQQYFTRPIFTRGSFNTGDIIRLFRLPAVIAKSFSTRDKLKIIIKGLIGHRIR